MATLEEADEAAIDFLKSMVESSNYSDGYRLEAAREILKYSRR